MNNKFEFRLTTHGDILFCDDKNNYNFGYHDNLRIPIIFWLFSKQMNRQNPFLGLDYSKYVKKSEGIEKSREIEKFEEVNNDLDLILPTLPIENLDKFNQMCWRFNYLGDGSAYTVYQYTLEKDEKISLSQKPYRENTPLKKMSIFTLEQGEKVAKNYLEFLFNEERLHVFYNPMNSLITKLRRIHN
jgi:hypothetical protein